jgi:hypothetical protein
MRFAVHRLSTETVVAHSNWNAVMNEGTNGERFFSIHAVMMILLF